MPLDAYLSQMDAVAESKEVMSIFMWKKMGKNHNRIDRRAEL